MSDFNTLGQMQDECRHRNGMAWVIEFERWYFIAPPTLETHEGPAKPARIEYIEGPKALEMRARANGTYQTAWEPEPGEMAWIKKAVGEFIRRNPQPASENDGAYKDRFRRQLAMWSASAPWRKMDDAA